MLFQRLEVRLFGWTGALLCCAMVFGYAWHAEGLIVTAALALALAGLALLQLINLAKQGNQEALRVLDAMQHGDMSQSFSGSLTGAGLDSLRQRCEQLVERIHGERMQSERQLRETTYMLEHVPMALLRIRQDGAVQLLNHAARSLCAGSSISRVEDLAVFGDEAVSRLPSIPSGTTASVTLQIAGRARSFAALTSQISSSDAHWTLVSLLDIQSELDRVQLQAWQELVSVLTHELMNSITPIASLAATTGDLLQDVTQSLDEQVARHDSMQDMADALTTIARRANGLRDFVQGYRTLSKMPPPRLAELPLQTLFKEVLALFEQTDKHMAVEVDIAPENLSVWADRDQLQQVLLNLLRNAAEAAGTGTQPHIHLSAEQLKGEQIEIRVADNGGGIEEEHLARLFMPFFTTKRQGSGVGLALTRQVMLAHGGTVTAHNRPEGGAEFRLCF